MVKVYDPYSRRYKEQIYNLPQAALAATALYLGYRLVTNVVEPAPSTNVVRNVKISYYSRIGAEGLVGPVEVSKGQTIRGLTNAIILEYAITGPDSVATAEVYVRHVVVYVWVLYYRPKLPVHHPHAWKPLSTLVNAVLFHIYCGDFVVVDTPTIESR